MNLMVLVEDSWGIGCGGEQMVYLSEDLKRFKEMTLGKTVIVGRKTLATFPEGKPLRGRRNIILSRDRGFTVADGEVFYSLEDLFFALSEEFLSSDDVIVVGGASVYQELLPYCKKAYVTKVRGSYEVDCRMTDLDSVSSWEFFETSPIQRDGDVEYTYCTYVNTAVKPFK